MDPKRSPRSLQNKVMFDIRFYFARRGAENFKTMKTDIFQVVHDSQHDTVYVMKSADELKKNHKEIDNEVISGYMPELPGDPMCPVDSFREYLSHLNPDCENLWQPPIPKPATSVWYAKSTVGDHTISDFMKNLSKDAKLSRKYTNHDIRVTGLSILGRCNFSDKQIMAVSGHKSIESLKIYKKVSANEKFMMGYTLGYALKNSNAIPENEDPLPIEFPEDILQPKKKKRKIGNKENSTLMDPSKMQLVPVNEPRAVAALQQAPFETMPNAQPNENLVQIPNEYDFDIMALLADMQNDNMQQEEKQENTMEILPKSPRPLVNSETITTV